MSRLGAVAPTHCSAWSEPAAWSFSAGARRRRVDPPHVTLVPVSCVRTWFHSMGGEPDVLVSGVLTSPEDEVHDGLVQTRPRGG